jgi:hypothetical protein
MVEFDYDVSGPIMVKGFKVMGGSKWNVTNTNHYQMCMVGCNSSTSLE